MEAQTSFFHAKQKSHTEGSQRAIEQALASKQAGETIMVQAREQYEMDCMRINAYTAQLRFVKGQGAERVYSKLERAQQGTVSNERAFAEAARARADAKWEEGWRGFCDSCRDLEDERLEFVTANMRAYANAVSATISAGMREDAARTGESGGREGRADLCAQLWHGSATPPPSRPPALPSTSAVRATRTTRRLSP
ncbi:hypothetical protein DFH09DRAFT_123014 [Mycena vulgaris]|nr:hypothetical protein DFH09DRAFT_123014 [Mycena vulgaris]